MLLLVVMRIIVKLINSNKMAGRKSLPTAMKVVRGTLRPDRSNPNEPTPDVVKLVAPDWLSERARDAFNELSTLLVNQRILTEMDGMALTLLCDQWNDYHEARAFIDANGQYSTGIDGNGNVTIKAYPQMATIATTYANILRMLTEFGATPASRSKVSASKETEVDPLDALIGKASQRHNN